MMYGRRTLGIAATIAAATLGGLGPRLGSATSDGREAVAPVDVHRALNHRSNLTVPLTLRSFAGSRCRVEVAARSRRDAPRITRREFAWGGQFQMDRIMSAVRCVRNSGWAGGSSGSALNG